VPTPDTRSSIVITKSFLYRGATRLWTNRYHFEGDTPADDAHWTTFADAIVAAEKVPLSTFVTIVQATGYDKATATTTNPHGDAVFTKTYDVDGLYDGPVDQPYISGNDALMVRYSTPARTPKNHPVYLFNYYHGAQRQNTNLDSLLTACKTAFQTYADHWVSGFSDGVENHERCGPRGAVAISALVDPWVRHRDFPS